MFQRLRHHASLDLNDLGNLRTFTCGLPPSECVDNKNPGLFAQWAKVAQKQQ